MSAHNFNSLKIEYEWKMPKEGEDETFEFCPFGVDSGEVHHIWTPTLKMYGDKIKVTLCPTSEQVDEDAAYKIECRIGNAAEVDNVDYHKRDEPAVFVIKRTQIPESANTITFIVREIESKFKKSKKNAKKRSSPKKKPFIDDEAEEDEDADEDADEDDDDDDDDRQPSPPKKAKKLQVKEEDSDIEEV